MIDERLEPLHLTFIEGLTGLNIRQLSDKLNDILTNEKNTDMFMSPAWTSLDMAVAYETPLVIDGLTYVYKSVPTMREGDHAPGWMIDQMRFATKKELDAMLDSWPLRPLTKPSDVRLIKDAHIERAAFDAFLVKYDTGAYAGCRLGQAFYNEFNLHRVADQAALGKLYEMDGKVAIAHIWTIFQFN